MNKDIYITVIIIGSIVFSIILLSLPILTTVAFMYNWSALVKFFLVGGSSIELIILIMMISMRCLEL